MHDLTLAFPELAQQKRMKIDPHYHRQENSQVSVDFSDVQTVYKFAR